MFDDSKVRDELREVMRGADRYIEANASRMSFADYLRLVQHRNLGRDTRSIKIKIGWKRPDAA